ncbi:MAG TPA: diguanylate cyclase [Nitrospirota bacterium]
MKTDVFQRADFLLELLNAVPSMILIVDTDLRIHHVNAAATKGLGLDTDVIFMMRSGEALHCIRASETPAGCGGAVACGDCLLRNSVTRALREQKVFRECALMELATKDGISSVQLLITASPITYGGKRYTVLALENITGLKEIEGSLRASEAKLRNITAVMGEGVYVLDRDMRLLFMNPEAERLLGWTEKELLGAYAHDVFHAGKADGGAPPVQECPLYNTINTGAIYRAENELFVRKDGTTFSASLVSTPLREEGVITGSVTVFRDITDIARTTAELKRLNELLERRATIDALTNICNRLKFSELVEHEIREFDRYRHPLSLIMFDIDNFKWINDEEGHQGGDAVLRELVSLVKENIRASDIFGRWGGEEFMILLPHTPLDETKWISEKLRKMIEANEFSFGRTVTCSFGITQCVDGDTLDSFTNRADIAMYSAKDGGKNRVEVFDTGA